MILSPVIGMVVAFGIMVALLNMLKKLTPATVTKYFKKLQIVSTCAVSFSHGANDAQKTMGVITFLLIGTNYINSGGGSFHVPDWVALIAYTAIALGTFVGGWRIIRTMGMRITHLEPIHGFAAQTAFCRGDSWSKSFRNPGEHNSCCLGVNNGGRFHEEILRCSLGYREKDSVGLDTSPYQCLHWSLALYS